MGQICSICGINTIFFKWSTCRRFPKYLFPKQLDKDGKMRGNFVVCFHCLNEMKDKMIE